MDDTIDHERIPLTTPYKHELFIIAGPVALCIPYCGTSTRLMGDAVSYLIPFLGKYDELDCLFTLGDIFVGKDRIDDD